MFRVHSTSSHQITHFACEIPLKVEEPVPEAQASEQQERSQGLLNVTSRKRRRIRCFHVKADAVLLGQSRAHLSHCSQVVLEQTLRKAAPSRQTASYACRDRPCISALSARRHRQGEAAASADSLSRGKELDRCLPPALPVRGPQRCACGMGAALPRGAAGKGGHGTWLSEACLLNKTRSPSLGLCRG